MNRFMVMAVAVVMLAAGGTPRAAGSEGGPSAASQRNDLTESNLVRLQGVLNDPSKRLNAIAQLADFASMKLYRIGSVFMVYPDPIQDGLRQRAADLAQTHTDAGTVRLALESSDPRLHQWGIWFWNAGAYKATRAAGRQPLELPENGLTDEEKTWRALLPLIRQRAADGPWRGQAIEALAFYTRKESREFLLSLIPKETEPMVLLRLIDYTEPPKYMDPTSRALHPPPMRNERFSRELLRLLAGANHGIRHRALAEIGGNWQMAEMWQVRFLPEITQCVAELRNSDDPEDRRDAEWAQQGLQKSAAIWAERDAAK